MGDLMMSGSGLAGTSTIGPYECAENGSERVGKTNHIPRSSEAHFHASGQAGALDRTSLARTIIGPSRGKLRNWVGQSAGMCASSAGLCLLPFATRILVTDGCHRRKPTRTVNVIEEIVEARARTNFIWLERSLCARLRTFDRSGGTLDRS
jgi:hypothetical protein